ncbi:hypothetical protein [Variovorax sp. 350MFTsu5.1]|uniref:hypothetical protein n=1 Tax=Variovorax sp. 350MFTsu5.1 TaxID=3158365 RepID=UPI003AAA696B
MTGSKKISLEEKIGIAGAGFTENARKVNCGNILRWIESSKLKNEDLELVASAVVVG